MEVNGTYWKDPSYPNDPDNWVYAPTACPCCCFPLGFMHCSSRTLYVI